MAFCSPWIRHEHGTHACRQNPHIHKNKSFKKFSSREITQWVVHLSHKGNPQNPYKFPQVFTQENSHIYIYTIVRSQRNAGLVLLNTCGSSKHFSSQPLPQTSPSQVLGFPSLPPTSDPCITAILATSPPLSWPLDTRLL